jgi:16S rRNA (guanine527-N7)-methyltransferase
VAHLELTDRQLSDIERYYWLLARWNRVINLTSFSLETLGDEAIDRLLVEPIIVATHFPDSEIDWIDIGSGGGSPAIPIKIIRPTASLTMLESRTRKVSFLREVIRELGLARAAVLDKRLEVAAQDSSLIGAFALITIRAVRLDLKILGYLRQLLKPEGRLFLIGSIVLPTTQLAVVESIQLLPVFGSCLSILQK